VNDQRAYDAAKALFVELLELGPLERRTRLAEIPDPSEREEVEALLRADAEPIEQLS
jgi:hypothetical protein